MSCPTPDRAIANLLKRAAREYQRDGLVAADTEVLLASEGYLLGRLERDVQAIIQSDGDDV